MWKSVFEVDGATLEPGTAFGDVAQGMPGVVMQIKQQDHGRLAGNMEGSAALFAKQVLIGGL